MFSFWKKVKELPKKAKVRKLKRRKGVTVVKNYSSKEFDNFYCKFIRDGKELIGVIGGTNCKKYSSGRIEKTFHIAAAKEWFIDSGEIQILGKNPDELTKLKYQNQILRQKNNNQKKEIKKSLDAVDYYQRDCSTYRKMNQKLIDESINENLLKECLRLAIHDPARGLLSPVDKERKLVTLIVKELDDE